MCYYSYSFSQVYPVCAIKLGGSKEYGFSQFMDEWVILRFDCIAFRN